MRVFVSGKFEDKKNVRKLMDKIEALGHTITHDWTKDKETDEGYPVVHAMNDLRGVQVCDALVGRFIKKNHYRGSLAELGAALALDKRVYIIGHGADECIFVNHPRVIRCSDEQEFLSYVRQAL